MLMVGVFANCYLFLFHRERLIMWLYSAASAAYLIIAAVARDAVLPFFAGAAAVAMTGLAIGAVVAVAALLRHRATPSLPEGDESFR